MVDRAIDDKSPDTLVVVSGEGFWTGSSTLPHLHHFFACAVAALLLVPDRRVRCETVRGSTLIRAPAGSHELHRAAL